MSAPNRTVLIAAACVIVLLASLGAIVWQWRGGRNPPIPRREWFFDVNTHQLYVVPRGQISPADAPSGPLPDHTPAGVRAYVYGCGDCAEAHRFIAYLEMSSPELQAKMKAPIDDGSAEPRRPAYGEATPGRGTLVSRADEIQWFEMTSPEGQQILAQSLNNRCPAGVIPSICFPK